MRTTHTMTISLPPAMAEEVEKVRKAQHRTRSELVREALRAYFNGRHTMVEPTRAELRRIRAGRSEIKRGDYVTFDQLLDVLGTADRQARPKGARRRSK